MGRKTHIKRIIMLVFMLALMTALGSNASAASKNQRALAAYKKILSKGTYSYWQSGVNYYSGKKYKYKEKVKLKQFAIIDVNKDGVKEMIARESVYGGMLIFAYTGKKAVRVCTEYTYQSMEVRYNPTLKTLIFQRGGSAEYLEYSYVKVTSKGKLKRTIMTLDVNDGVLYWMKNGKRISEKTWEKTNTKLRGNNLWGVRFYSNTKKNRKKIGKLNPVA